MIKEPCNGYTNYPTWSVMCHLDSNEGRADFITIARSLLEQYEREDATRELADMIQIRVEEFAPVVPAENTTSDLLEWALQQVNWWEIAESFIEEVYEDVEIMYGEIVDEREEMIVEEIQKRLGCSTSQAQRLFMSDVFDDCELAELSDLWEEEGDTDE